LSSVRTSPTYVDPAGHIIPSVNIVEPERQEINTKTFTLPAFPYKADDSATPTEALTSPRSTEFAMAPLNPSAEVESADSFGLMSPTSTEFASSPFDRSALLAQLGMGSMQHHDQLPLRTRSNNPQSKSRSLATPSGKMLRGKISSPSIREQQELQRLQADIEMKLHIEQQQNHQRQHHHQPLLPKPAGAPQPTLGGFGDALMSPRATEFTENPFAIALAPSTATTITEEQKPTALDPRSPAHKGVSPITRNIGDVLWPVWLAASAASQVSTLMTEKTSVGTPAAALLDSLEIEVQDESMSSLQSHSLGDSRFVFPTSPSYTTFAVSLSFFALAVPREGVVFLSGVVWLHLLCSPMFCPGNAQNHMKVRDGYTAGILFFPFLSVSYSRCSREQAWRVSEGFESMWRL
jgi:hypothetical protein